MHGPCLQFETRKTCYDGPSTRHTGSKVGALSWMPGWSRQLFALQHPNLADIAIYLPRLFIPESETVEASNNVSGIAWVLFHQQPQDSCLNARLLLKALLAAYDLKRHPPIRSMILALPNLLATVSNARDGGPTSKAMVKILKNRKNKPSHLPKAPTSNVPQQFILVGNVRARSGCCADMLAAHNGKY